MKGALLVAGTSSDAGKSMIVAGLCRWLARQGVRVAPFKAQNMSLNSFVTADGAEIGRAQAMQAAAAGIEPHARMNPVLLKPGSDRRSQVVLLGHPVAEVDAVGYRGQAAALLEVALDSLSQLRRDYDVVICEGAGSPAEINLRGTDIANMGLARAAHLPVIVAGDIDRGGVFAAMYGTLALLEAADQELIAGFVINKFRGAPELLDSGLEMLRGLTGRPMLGVVPFTEGLWLDVEDSLSLDLARRPAAVAPHGADLLRVSVIRLPRISNVTDIDALSAEPGVLVRFAATPAELADADLVVLPGTRATVDDLNWLRRARPRGRDHGARRPRAAGARHLRWLPDAGARDRRRGRVGRGHGARARPAARPGQLRPGQAAGPGPPDRPTERPWRGMRSITASSRSRTPGPLPSSMAAGPRAPGARAGTARWRMTRSAGPSWPRWRNSPGVTSPPRRISVSPPCGRHSSMGWATWWPRIWTRRF